MKMTEEDFYKEKIFNKSSINQIKVQFPELVNWVKIWYKSDRFKEIQKIKTFLTKKLKQMSGAEIKFDNQKLYHLFKWWDSTPKVCYYCSIPENILEDLHNQPNHINKRYPQRGKSLEIDRKHADLPYSDIHNLVLACYWCNNAKTDTFTEKEFKQLGKVIKRIWEKRLNKQV